MHTCACTGLPCCNSDDLLPLPFNDLLPLSFNDLLLLHFNGLLPFPFSCKVVLQQNKLDHLRDESLAISKALDERKLALDQREQDLARYGGGAGIGVGLVWGRDQV